MVSSISIINIIIGFTTIIIENYLKVKNSCPKTNLSEMEFNRKYYFNSIFLIMFMNNQINTKKLEK